LAISYILKLSNIEHLKPRTYTLFTCGYDDMAYGGDSKVNNGSRFSGYGSTGNNSKKSQR